MEELKEELKKEFALYKSGYMDLDGVADFFTQRCISKPDLKKWAEGKKRILENGYGDDSLDIAIAHTTLVHNQVLQDLLAFINNE